MEIIDAIDLYNQYLLVEKGLQKLTIQDYDEDLKLFFNFFSNKNDTSELSSTDLIDFFKYELSNGKSISTALRRLSSIRNFYIFLSKEKIINEEIDDVESIKKPKHLPNCLTKEEVDMLLDMPNINKIEGLRDKTMLEVMYACGLRVSELILLEKRQINFAHNIISIFGKGAKERRIPIGDFALNYIKKYLTEIEKYPVLNNSKYLFTNKTGKPLSRQYFFKQIKKYAKEAGINSNVSPHTLRHCFATHLVESKIELRYVQQMLGHTNLATTEIYTHVSSKRILSAYDQYMTK